MTSKLHPIHRSIKARGFSLLPRNMSRIALPDELSDELTNIALDIFTDASNVGHPFQDALLAVYLSGLQHGAAITQEKSE